MSNYYNRQWRLPNNENKDKQSNYSMDFSVDQVIVLNQSLDLGTNNTVSFWIKGDSSGLNGSLFGKSGTDYFITIFPSAVYYKIGGNYGSGFPNTYTATVDDNWHNVVFVRSGDSVSSYVDGSFIETNTGYGTTTSTTFNTIGNKENLASDIVGQFDAVSCFNYALSASQVTTLYGSSSTGIGNPMSLSPKPVAYYPLGDQDSFNGSNYLVPNSSLKDYVFSFDRNSSASGNDRIDISNFNYTGNKTVSFWINWDSNAEGCVLGHNTNGYYYPYIRYYNNYTHIWLKDSSSGVGQVQYSIAPDIGRWYHYCITGDGTTATVYIDGNSVGTTTDRNLDINQINAYNNILGNDCKLSNVQIFNTALPATGSNSVETLYNNGSPLTSMSGFSSLVSWYKLDASDTYDSSTGNWTITDHSSNSNDGTSSGMTQANLVQSDLSFTSGYSPYALSFDSASSDRIDTGAKILNNMTSYTASIWAKGWSTSTLTAIMSQYDGGSVSPLILTARHSSNTNGFTAWLTLGGTFYTSHNDEGFSDNTKWVNLTVTWDGSDLILYVNGIAGDVTSASGTIDNSTTYNFHIGGYSNVTSNSYDGQLSNCSVWNAALTSAQVSEIYSDGVPQNLNNHSAYSNLVSWWQLGSNSSFNTNWTVLDEKGSNNGTSVNMTEADIVDGVGSYANGLSSGMGGDEVKGDAPYSTANALSVNMDVEDRVSDTPS